MIYPYSFCIPKNYIIRDVKKFNKKYDFVDNMTRNNKLYRFNANQEKEYHQSYQNSFFSITKKKAGWDSLRHYEIIANGCLPYFIDIKNCPENSLMLWNNDLKNLMFQIKTIRGVYPDHIDFNNFDIKHYINIRKKLINILRKKYTTHNMARYIIKTAGFNPEKIKKILYLVNKDKHQYKYHNLMILHGLKILYGNNNVIDYYKHKYLYKINTDQELKIRETIHGHGFTVCFLLDDTNENINRDEPHIFNEIKSHNYDLIFVSDIYCMFLKKRKKSSDIIIPPIWDYINKFYKKNEIILLDGADIHKSDLPHKLSDQGYNVFVRELSKY